jgi:hypothetical protein
MLAKLNSGIAAQLLTRLHRWYNLNSRRTIANDSDGQVLVVKLAGPIRAMN